jgi:hypothetical protein
LRRLLLVRLKQPACKITEIRILKDLWLQHTQGSTAADRFFSADEAKYEMYEAAGGSYPDNLRIEVTRPRLSPALLLAYDAFQDMEMCRGAYDPMLENDWAVFSAAAIRVGASLLKKAESLHDPAATPVAPAAAAAVDHRARNLMPVTAEIAAAGSGCWKWSHVGVCSYGDNCRFPHLGTAGAHRHTVADADGYCLMQKKGVCSRNNCPFLHSDAQGGAAAEGQQPQLPATRPTGDPKCYPAAARKVFTVLHQEKAEKTRKMREHNVSSEDFFAPGTRTAAGDLKPRWVKDIPEENSSCEDY